MNSKKGKIAALIIGIIFIVIAGYVVINLFQLKDISIGKTVQIGFENTDADDLVRLLEQENEKDPGNKLILLDREAVEQLIQYMKDNQVRIVSGEYEIPQTSNYSELMKILEFEPYCDNETDE